MPGGRPTRYTPERVAKILQAIRVGATQRAAAAYAGIDDSTIMRWKHKYPSLATAINEAEGAAMVGWLAKIEQAANEGAWQAAAWKLERRYPHEYGRSAVEVSGRDGGAIKIDHKVEDAREVLAVRLSRIAAARGETGRDTDLDPDPGSSGSDPV